MIRSATHDDVPVIADLIRALAAYERLSHEVSFSEDDLRQALFGERRYAEVLLAQHGAEVVGFALFFHNFSTFLGKAGVYLEDLFVRPAHRGQGYGKALLSELASVAVVRGCGRLEWSVLDWNERSIAFYRSLGAEAMDDWTVFRLTGDSLRSLATSASEPENRS